MNKYSCIPHKAGILRASAWTDDMCYSVLHSTVCVSITVQLSDRLNCISVQSSLSSSAYIHTIVTPCLGSETKQDLKAPSSTSLCFLFHLSFCHALCEMCFFNLFLLIDSFFLSYLRHELRLSYTAWAPCGAFACPQLFSPATAGYELVS